MFYVLGGANAHIGSMEVDLARLWSMEENLAIVKVTLSYRDMEITSLEKIVKHL